jgi:hypothetical protein
MRVHRGRDDRRRGDVPPSAAQRKTQRPDAPLVASATSTVVAAAALDGTRIPDT